MKNIIFGITNLSLGGAERVLVDLCNNLCNTYNITIFTFYGKGEFEKDLSEKINLIHIYNNSYSELNKIKKIFIPLKLFLFKKQIYKKYIKNKFDIEIAFLEGSITNLFSVKNNSAKKIAWIHNDISLIFGNNFKSKLKKIINKKVYAKYEKLIFVSKDNLEQFNNFYNIPIPKQIIYNYIDKDKILEKSLEKIEFNPSAPSFLSVARLVTQKGIDRLARVHYTLIKNGFIHSIFIIGEGPERKNIEKIIKHLKIENTFILLGKKENPYPYIKKADVFCLFSKFEGYGMVIEEAKILNKFITITDTAAREAVNGYEQSTILENSETGIYNGIKELILNKENYLEKNTKLIYNNEEIINKIINILEV